MKRYAWLLIAVVCGAVWFTSLRPQKLGGPTTYVTIKGTSMLPTYDPGDLVVTRKASSYAKGDTVAFKVRKGDFGAGAVVIHRIIGGSAKEGFVLQGDNNPASDPWRPQPSDIAGRPMFRVPKLGLVLGFLHAPVPLAALATAIAVVFVLFPKKKSVAEADVETELTSDDDALHLARPLADLEDLGVPVEPRDGELLDVAVAAVDLDGLSRDVDGHLGREELCHRGFRLERPPVLAVLPCVVHREARVMDLGRHVGDLELDGLEAFDGSSELPSLGDVA